jgi:hypothetical protein
MSRKPLGGVVVIGISTVIAGLAGYAVTLLVYRVVGAGSYAVFAIFWAAMYLLIGGLSGIQQEVARATVPLDGIATPRRTRARNFGAVIAAATTVLIIATAPAWSRAVFPSAGWLLVWPLAVGAGSSVVVAVLIGSLYGVSRWRRVATMVAFDALLRLALVGIVLFFTHDIVLLAWAAALPFPVTVVVLWPVLRRRFAGTTQITIPYRALSWNAARAIVASLSTAVLVSGFPLLLGVTSKGEPAALVGELIFTITLTRAPLIISVMSLQSYLVVRFRDRPTDWFSLFWRVLAVVAGCAVIIAALGWLLGVPVLEWFSGHSISLSGASIAVLVLSSALVGMLCVTGPAVLARSLHFPYSLGWLVAALATIGAMVLPLPFLDRVMLALLVGPVAGLLVHLVVLLPLVRGSRKASIA